LNVPTSFTFGWAAWVFILPIIQQEDLNMTTSPTSRSALLSGAAKDDTLGADGSFTFSIADLLANDPGGAAKVDVGTQFFFGDTAADQANQAQYLLDHGITDNGDGTYTITSGGEDFNYFVQIGNKGTWSTASVDVTAPDVVIDPHSGDALFTENFDGYEGFEYQASGDHWQSTNLTEASGWTGPTAAGSELGSDGYLAVETTSGAGEEAYWLDTQNSIGPINIENTFFDFTAPVDGKTATLSFDIAKQDADGHTTSPAESFEFRIDGVMVAQIDAADLANSGEMYHYEFDISGYAAAGDQHTIQLIDTTSLADASYNGFSVDSIQINDWVV
jgi:hypothetical protein